VAGGRLLGFSQASATVRLVEGAWLASHSCMSAMSQGHPHIARYHTTTCQQLPTPGGETLHTAHPFSTGWGEPRHLGVDDIAASCHFESRNCHVR
jgi:hypothetical protein